MSFNFIRRSPLKKKPREHKESAPWRRPKVRLNGKEMMELRFYAAIRSNGRCENAPFIDLPGERCPKFISRWNGQLAHIESRGRGGSDSKENVLFVCRECHLEDTRNRNKLIPHKDWKP